MPITNSVRALYVAVIISIQIYFAYAATLYMEIRSAAFGMVLLTFIFCAGLICFYVFVLVRKDEVDSYNATYREVEETKSKE